MINTNSEKFKFQIEINNVLEIICKDIYDSSYAMLRENVQNAYDAILMRRQNSGNEWGLENAFININISDNIISIEDNGIGMTKETLKNNFWKAGSSGKKGELAKKAGVIGTFGIGAMANFGVCKKLRVETKFVESSETLISELDKEEISLSNDCIQLTTSNDLREPGTKIIVEINDKSQITIEQAQSYLEQYIKYIPVKIMINSVNASQKDYKKLLFHDDEKLSEIGRQNISNGFYSTDLVAKVDKSGDIVISMSNIKFAGVLIEGEIILRQGKEYIEGLRNYFGLAPIPNMQSYRLGGVANLFILQPTAGREALSRESIDYVNNLIALAEENITIMLSQTEFANKNNMFLNYIFARGKYDLSDYVKVEVKPDNMEIYMKDIRDVFSEFNIYYYTGRDISIINSFSSQDKKLLLLSQSNPRQRIQIEYLNRLGVKQVPDQIMITKKYNEKELTDGEFSFIFKLKRILEEDYFLRDVDICMADISHNVPYKVEKIDDKLEVYFSRDHSTIQPLLDCYKTDYGVFSSLIKDFVRIYLYSYISNYVPSASRQGLDQLRKILLSKKEEFEIKYSEQGQFEFEFELDKYRKGEVSLASVIESANMVSTIHSQEVDSSQVGQIESIIPDIVNKPKLNNTLINGVIDNNNIVNSSECIALPAISRDYIETNMKILTVEKSVEQLNNFKMFLCLTDRVYDLNLDFFLQPHTTKIIWGAHRIIYIFSHPSGKITLYYDIDLEQSIENSSIGGNAFTTTTIITKNKIFVPIPEQLIPTFRVEQNSKKFYIRYDEVIL